MTDNYDPKQLFPGIAVLLILIGVVVIGKLDLKPLRPPTDRPIDYSGSTPIHIQARLWQDPFAVVDRYDSAVVARESDRPIIREARDILVDRLNKIGAGNTAIESVDKDPREVFADCWNGDKSDVECEDLLEKLRDLGSLVQTRQSTRFVNKYLGLREEPAVTPGPSNGSRESVELTGDAEAGNDRKCEGGLGLRAFDFRCSVVLSVLGFSLDTHPKDLNIFQELITREVYGLNRNPQDADIFPRFEELYSAKNLEKLGDKHPVQILWVALPSGPYADLAERRMRSRYAVIAALAMRDYFPRSAEYIDVWRTSGGDCVLPSVCVVESAPYEWFDYAGNGEEQDENVERATRSVMVMWLKDEEIGSRPIAKYARIAELVERYARDKIKRICKEEEGSDCDSVYESHRIRFSILGPYASSYHVAARKEKFCESAGFRKDYFRCIDNNASKRELLGRLRFFNWSATAIIEQAESMSPWNSIDSYKYISSDKAVAQEIKKILGRRGVSARMEQCSSEIPWTEGFSCIPSILQRRNTLLLVGESDTLYARRLAEVFRNELAGQFDNILDITYLRGIDGQLPGDSGQRGSAGESAAVGEENLIQSLTSSGQIHLPVGRNQFDYIRRVAQAMKNESVNVKAIGVLGSDVYDKVLVMQAIRSYFPDAIYFTTDLDALYLNDTVFRAMRNNIVGSGFGLTLNPAFLGTDADRWPPFRDSYQTSLFYSTFRALQPDDVPLVRKAPEPRVFEVGHRRLFALNKPCKSSDKKSVLECVHPPNSSLQDRYYAAGYLAPVLMFTIFVVAGLLLIRAATRGRVMEKHRNRLGFIYVVFAFATSLLPLALFQEEARSWTAGVSLWPAFTLVWLSALLAWLAWKWLNEALKSVKKNIENEYFGDINTKKFDDMSVCERSWKKFCATVSIKEPPYVDHARVKKLVRSDRRVDDRSLFGLMARYMPFSVLLGLILAALIVVFPPSSHTLSSDANALLRMIYVGLGYLVVLGPIVYLTLRLRALMVGLVGLMGDISQEDNVWPPRMLEAIGRQYGLCRTEAESWLDIQLVTRITRAVYSSYYGPFVVILVLICSRLPYFDQWPVSNGISYGLAVLLLVSIYQNYEIHRAARELREVVLARFSEVRMQIMLRQNTGHTAYSYLSTEERLAIHDRAVEEVAGMNEGAFLPLTQQPFVRLLLVLLGASGLILAQYLTGTLL